MEEKNNCAMCFVGIIFALLEIFIVLGESLGWISYTLDLESFLFIIFLSFIVFYHDKTKKMEVKKYE